MLDVLENKDLLENKTVLDQTFDMILYSMGVTPEELVEVDMDKVKQVYKQARSLNASQAQINNILKMAITRFKKPKSEPEQELGSGAKFKKKNFRRKKSRIEGDPNSGYNTFKRITLLATINERPNLTTREIAERGGVCYSRTTQILKEWEVAGLVEKVRSLRNNIWKITPEGTVFLRERSFAKLRRDLQSEDCNTLHKNANLHPEALSLLAEQAQIIVKRLREMGWRCTKIHAAIAKFGIPRILQVMAEAEATEGIRHLGKYIYSLLYGAKDSRRIAGLINKKLGFASEEVKDMFAYKAESMTPENYCHLANILAKWHRRGRELFVGDVSAAEGFMKKNQRN